MCALAHNMESFLFTVTVLLCISNDAAKHSADCTPGKSMACAAMNLDKANICYTKSKHKWKATITCDKGTLTGPETYTCQKSTKIWTPSFASSCAGTYKSSGYLGCFEDYENRVLQEKKHTSVQNSGDYCKNICKSFRYAGTENGYECFCGNSMRVENARNGCNFQCPGSQDETCGGYWRISIYDLWQVPKTTTSALNTTQSPNETNAFSARERITFSDIPVTTTSASTTGTTVSPNQTNAQDNTALSSLASSDGTGSVVIPVVFVFVVIVIALAAVIVFIIWRRKRQRSLTDTGDNSGTTDMHYQDLRPDNSAESEYTEYLTNNLNAEETAGAAYQTIDSLSEDQTECNSGYGHLKIHTIKSNDDYYLNVAVNTISSTASMDATYANTAYEENVLLQNQETRNLDTITIQNIGN